jgi:hypothetical protein
MDVSWMLSLLCGLSGLPAARFDDCRSLRDRISLLRSSLLLSLPFLSLLPLSFSLFYLSRFSHLSFASSPRTGFHFSLTL